MILYDYYYQACAPPPISDLILALLSGLDAINPQTEHNMNFNTVRPLLNTYEDILNIISAVLSSRKRCSSTMGFNFRDTTAVSSAECERSFSAMNRWKTPGRSTMSDIRTSDFVLLAHEKNLSRA